VRALLLLVALALVILALFWIFQRRLIYIPFDHNVPPARDGLPGAEEVRLETADGLTLNGWLLRPTAREERGAVLVFNGNAGHRGHRAPLAEALARVGFAVLLIDYRGYGENAGSPSEQGLRLDADAALDLVLARGYALDRIVYFGESLGAAVAIELATRRHPAAVVVRSPFSSLADIGRTHYPFLPVRLLLRDRFPSVERVASIGAPLLIIAGERDSIVPLRSSRALYEAAVEPKHMVVFDGADHNDAELLAGREMIAAVVSFLRESLPERE
jgi:fermentation-respiration switch protein FrsA (DUF1100 family)